ncbi:MAG: hypothetical protein JXR96_06955 [Deltaproteobacteria bacterium]|nr:hypothetical protein [Deltaproteobacteria bacterium]
MRASLAILGLVVSGLAVGCGSDATNRYGIENTDLLISTPGDQIHPAVGGGRLVWFDLEPDPDGSCFVRSGGEYDDSCEGVLRSVSLLGGKPRTISDLLFEEVWPAVSDGLVAWRCVQEQVGLCVVDLGGGEMTFHAAMGAGYTWYYDRQSSPVVDGVSIFWGDYDYESYRYVIRQGNLRTGEMGIAVADLPSYPGEIAAYDGRLAWIESAYDETGYHSRVVEMDLASGARSWVADVDQPCYGLGAGGGMLAWKQGEPDYTGEGEDDVHVFFQDTEGQVQRADSEAARVSAETPISVGDGLLVWLDYRDGSYRVAAYEIASGQELLLSSETAVLGAYMPPAVSSHWVIWPDRQNGDWDLVLWTM